jgi:hypothetical protein
MGSSPNDHRTASGNNIIASPFNESYESIAVLQKENAKMKKFTMHQRALGLSTAFLLALSTGVAAQTPAGTTTAADIERAGYSDVTEVAPQYEESVNAFRAVAPDGDTVTIEIQEGTGEWLILNAEHSSVVTTYRAGEAPANALPMRDSGTAVGTPGMGDPGMEAPGPDSTEMDSPARVQPAPMD